jgi:hypothetical protein
MALSWNVPYMCFSLQACAVVQFVKAKSYLNDRFFQDRFLDMDGLQDDNHFIGIQLDFNHVLLAYSTVYIVKGPVHV